ncbi:hypothetical protein [Bradyrhizobium sp. 188]|uniref:hypothetical protein n=1 Tax=Bradyrhizobium sp. 188 TaxID=2782656 RepID=UPI001FFA39C8|nr:hypothetical protein [Bradyrhizobium sp. 188]MCK1501731.1 hypothetical protein [Bradyrhizobium sp. 188]
MLSFALTPKHRQERSSLGRQRRLIELSGHHHRSDDPSQPVGYGDTDDHGSTPFKQSFDPAASDPRACLWESNDVPRSDNKQVSEMGIQKMDEVEVAEAHIRR